MAQVLDFESNGGRTSTGKDQRYLFLRIHQKFSASL